MLYLTNFVNTIDGISVVFEVADGVHTDHMEDVRILYAAADGTQNLQGKIMLKHTPYLPLKVTCKYLCVLNMKGGHSRVCKSTWERLVEHLKVSSPIYDHAKIKGHNTSVVIFSIVGREAHISPEP